MLRYTYCNVYKKYNSAHLSTFSVFLYIYKIVQQNLVLYKYTILLYTFEYTLIQKYNG